jgi:hypothetical protein
MAASMWDPALRATLAERVKKLKGDTRPGWGKFSSSAMLAHLNDSYRMCTGELKVKSKNSPMRFTPIKQLIIYLAPVPKGLPTAPELLLRCDDAVLDAEKTAFEAMIAKLGRIKPGDPFPDHPAFGVLSHRAYGVLLAKHTEHHFRQFGL